MAKKQNKTAAEIEKLRTDLATVLAREQTEKAAALARGVTDKAAGLTREQEQAATALAEQRGREAARVEARLNEHDTHFKLLNGSMERSSKSLEQLTINVVTLTAEIHERNKHMTEDAATRFKEVEQRIDGTETLVTSLSAEKASVIGLQNRQIAFIGAIATAIYVVVASGIHP